jgi:uncharacterized protein YjbJ (UPF0337 family)
MDWNRIEGNWKQTAGKIKEKWGKLTDDDLTQINGKREQFEGKIQERYGIAKDQTRWPVSLATRPGAVGVNFLRRHLIGFIRYELPAMKSPGRLGTGRG